MEKRKNGRYGHGKPIVLPLRTGKNSTRHWNVPGGACGFRGACGAGISTGMFVSIISKSTPLAVEPFGLSHLMTSKALEQIGMVDDPHCCKRDSFLSILAAVDFVEQHFQVSIENSGTGCRKGEHGNDSLKLVASFQGVLPYIVGCLVIQQGVL